MNKFVKITVGFVHQTFKKNKEGKFVCAEQAFIASDQCDYEDLDGNPLEEVPKYGNRSGFFRPEVGVME